MACARHRTTRVVCVSSTAFITKERNIKNTFLALAAFSTSRVYTLKKKKAIKEQRQYTKFKEVSLCLEELLFFKVVSDKMYLLTAPDQRLKD